MSTHNKMSRIKHALPFGVLLLLFSFSLWGMGTLSNVSAQTDPTAPRVCRAAMVIDRSGSVGARNVEVLRNQIRRLFQPTGLYDSRIELAFWTFSDTSGVNNSTGNGAFAWIGVPPPGSNPDPNYNTKNFNAPYHSYVSSKGETPSTFNTMLNSIVSSGGTNYQQGFGYNDDVRNPALDSVFNQTDIIVFMTDGQPNAGGSWRVSSTEAGRNAALKHIASGKKIIGGSIGANPSQRETINYVVSGDYKNNDSTFVVSENYGDLATILKREIGEACGDLNPPVPCRYNSDILATDPRCLPPETPYSLVPTAVANSSIVSAADNAVFGYSVRNDSSNQSKETGWSIKKLVVNRGQSVDALNYNSGQQYRDEMSCAELVALVGGASRASCNDAASGSRIFGTGDTILENDEIGGIGQIEVDGDLDVGSKICYVLTIDLPTDRSSPTNRYSKAACIIVGKKPSVQVHGDDIIVGRHYRAESTVDSSGAKIQTGITSKGGSIDRTFGSWGEYGAFAPGLITGFASASGLEGGIARGAGDIRTLSSRLTFANTGAENGYYSQYNEMPPIPDTASYLLRGREVTDDLVAESSWSPDGKADGLYRKANGNLRIDAGSVAKGRSLIVSVPNGTVTVAGNISYDNDGYRSLAEIPQLVIVAKEIIVSAGVTNIDSWLIAKQASDGTGGRVTTCDVVGKLSSEMCNQALRINGPVMSNQLLLRRTGGSGVGSNSGVAAETFNLRPSVYLWAYNEDGGAQRVETTYTTELPPRF
ncbi:MAG: hypothetical protein EOO17_05500 [Chloroflexi bacterium]|nr:MAG: hypothetical protein EOO17_05500 [Chloroflexota bacterium]